MALNLRDQEKLQWGYYLSLYFKFWGAESRKSTPAESLHGVYFSCPLKVHPLAPNNTYPPIHLSNMDPTISFSFSLFSLSFPLFFLSLSLSREHDLYSRRLSASHRPCARAPALRRPLARAASITALWASDRVQHRLHPMPPDVRRGGEATPTCNSLSPHWAQRRAIAESRSSPSSSYVLLFPPIWPRAPSARRAIWPCTPPSASDPLRLMHRLALRVTGRRASRWQEKSQCVWRAGPAYKDWCLGASTGVERNFLRL